MVGVHGVPEEPLVVELGGEDVQALRITGDGVATLGQAPFAVRVRDACAREPLLELLEDSGDVLVGRLDRVESQYGEKEHGGPRTLRISS